MIHRERYTCTPYLQSHGKGRILSEALHILCHLGKSILGPMKFSTHQMEETLPPWTTKNYSHSYKEEKTRFCFETGYFGFKIDAYDLSKILFRVFEQDEEISYFEALSKSNRDRMDDSKLTEEELLIKISVPFDNEEEGKEIKTYRASSHTEAPKLWESGKIAQHYDFRGVEFRGEDKKEVLEGCDATFYILVWPDSVTFTIELSFEETLGWSHGFDLKLKLKDWTLEQHFNLDQKAEKIKASLHCNIDKDRVAILEKVLIDVSTTPKQELESIFSPHFNSFQLGRPNFQSLKRSFRGGYTDIRDYDVFKIRIKNNNPNIDAYVPVMLFVHRLANPTGCCPQLCDENYVPLGIPVQLSKNWHEKSMGDYGRFYCLLPAKRDVEWTTYYMRIIYGFYGTLPSASHANLSLVGYGSHGGRWEQLAIGCWGETYCMDIDMDCVEMTITDVRMIMTKGTNNRKWNWSDAGGRGDWLNICPVKTKVGKRLLPFGWKTAYNSHGPCLSEVFYDGWYSSDKSIEISANVKTLRTDDYARTFTSLNFIFNESMVAAGTTFFAMGGIPILKTPKVVIGNKDGLIEEYDVPENLKVGTFYIKDRELVGSGPYWIGFPDQEIAGSQEFGRGWRALIIRSFEGTFDEVKYTSLCVSLKATRKRYKTAGTNLTLYLTPPREMKKINIKNIFKGKSLEKFSKGDTLSLEVELITLPKHAEDYYGPNAAFKDHLKEKLNAWETVHREVVQNDLNVVIHQGGHVKHSYPVIIQAEANARIDFDIEGGVGIVPIRFDGLCDKHFSLFLCLEDNTEEEIKSQQEVHGEDFYQVEYDPLSCTYSLGFNVSLDGKPTSRWTLHAKEGNNAKAGRSSKEPKSLVVKDTKDL